MRSDIPEKRSSFASKERRSKQAWPQNRDFRVLSLDGGGIRGTFTAAFLAELEARAGIQAEDFFDLIVGTSTGGIIAIGLGTGVPAGALENLYTKEGCRIFPRARWPISWLWHGARFVFARYDTVALREALVNVLGSDRTLKDVKATRLCIQAFDAIHGDVFIFKTPHHPEYHLDGEKKLVDVALATSAAPTYFLPQESEEGYVLGDGGVWANNPVMIGIVEALSAFDVSPYRVKVLSIGCGDSYKPIGFFRRKFGGIFSWATIIETAMHLQSLSALGQAKHLVGPENILRIDVQDELAASIALDDVDQAVELLPALGRRAVRENWESISSLLSLRDEQPKLAE